MQVSRSFKAIPCPAWEGRGVATLSARNPASQLRSWKRGGSARGLWHWGQGADLWEPYNISQFSLFPAFSTHGMTGKKSLRRIMVGKEVILKRKAHTTVLRTIPGQFTRQEEGYSFNIKRFWEITHVCVQVEPHVLLESKSSLPLSCLGGETQECFFSFPTLHTSAPSILGFTALVATRYKMLIQDIIHVAKPRN